MCCFYAPHDEDCPEIGGRASWPIDKTGQVSPLIDGGRLGDVADCLGNST